MDDPAIFKALGAKMKYLQQRQTLIAQNLANANTPHYRPQDLTEVDFGRTLSHVLDERFGRVRIAATDARHFGPLSNTPPRSEEQDQTYEVKPSGNAVIVEEQSALASKSQADFTLMTTIYQKNNAMIMSAIGRGR